MTGQDGSAGHSSDQDPRVQAGLEHLQTAAREMIAASRSLLDVAEELVDDPRAVGRLLGLFEALGGVAARAAGRESGVSSAAAWADDTEDDPPVQRIPVS